MDTMKSLNLKSFDELQTMLARIDTHRRTVNELDYTREDILEEINSRVDMVPVLVMRKYLSRDEDDVFDATRSYFH